MNDGTQNPPIDPTQPPSAAEEKAGYRLLPDGSKHYLRANLFDYIACIILPGFGVIYGAYAFFKRGEHKRGKSMMLLGAFINVCELVSMYQK